MKRKLYILLTFFSFCFFQSCQDHEIKKAPEAAELISKIAAADDQKLLQGLGLLQEKASKNGRISQTKIASLQLDSAIKRLNPDLGSTNYSFSIEENKPYSLTNLVITENKGSYLAFFVEYISDNPKQGWNLANFSGKMKVTSVDGKREFERVVKPPQVKNGRTSSECEFNFAIVYVITPYGITQYTEWSFVCTLGGSGGFGWAVEGFGVGDGNNNGGSGNSGGEIDPGKIGIDDPNSPEQEFILPGIDDLAIDIEKYLNCFGSDQNGASYKVSLYVLEPNPGTGAEKMGLNVGHTFVGLTKTINGNTITQYIGFYPEHRTLTYPTESKMESNDNYGYTTSVTYEVSAGDFFSAIATATANASNLYHISQYNCTTYALDVCEAAGINLPRTLAEFPYGYGKGLSPGNLGADLRSRSVTDNKIKVTGGTSGNGNGPCQ
jgi:hypothetical protein